MSSILLRSTSGKWQYETTTDDRLFSPILGSMVEAGIELGKELTIEGALGEELDENWHYIEVLREWMDWQDKCTNVTDPLAEGVFKTSFILNDELQDENPSKETIRERVLVRFLPPPREVLWRHKMTVLINALNLPVGWELFVAVDERTSLIERRHHFQQGLAYLRKNGVIGVHQDRFYTQSGMVLAGMYMRDEKHIMAEGRDNRQICYSSAIDQLYRNVLLTEMSVRYDEMLVLEDGEYALFLDVLTMLDKLDWQIASEMSKIQEGEEVGRAQEKLDDLSRFMTGESNETDFALIMCVGDDGLYMYNGPCSSKDTPRLSVLYSRFLARLPEDADIGLQPIFGQNAENKRDRVPLHRLVDWMNFHTLTYLKGCKEENLAGMNSTKGRRTLAEIPIPRADFPEIVQLIGKTLGLYALRRMLLSLLHYLSKNTKTYSKKEVSKATQAKREKQACINRRVEYFCELAEKYLEEHEGEDEGVRTLRIGETEEAKNAREYYF